MLDRHQDPVGGAFNRVGDAVNVMNVADEGDVAVDRDPATVVGTACVDAGVT